MTSEQRTEKEKHEQDRQTEVKARIMTCAEFASDANNGHHENTFN